MALERAVAVTDAQSPTCCGVSAAAVAAKATLAASNGKNRRITERPPDRPIACRSKPIVVRSKSGRGKSACSTTDRRPRPKSWSIPPPLAAAALRARTTAETRIGTTFWRFVPELQSPTLEKTMSGTPSNLKVFAGASHPELAAEICHHLAIQLGRSHTVRFSNENLKIKIDENVREQDVFVVQTACSPLSEHIMELLIMLDALRHASAQRVTAVIPY